MRLDKLARLRDHRVFRDFTWPAELDSFARFNLFYGWNGSGKTTLSGLLKSLQNSAAVKEGQVDFVFDGNKVSGSSLATASIPQVRVFNRDTVSRSVFDSVAGSLEHLPPVYVFGEESADKQRQVDALKDQLPGLTSAASQAASKARAGLTALNEYAVDKAREIKNLLVAPGGSFNNYNVGTFRADISTFESNPSPALTDVERRASLDLKDAKPLSTITLPSLSFPDVMQLHAEARDALAKTVVSSVIADLTENAPVAAWIGAGLPLHTHGGDAVVCKFCEQPLAPTRLRRLEAHFNDEFRRFTAHLSALAQRVDGASRQIDSLVVPPATSLYPDLQGDYERAQRDLESQLWNVRRGLKALAGAMQQKQSHVFEPLALESLLTGGDGSKDEDAPFLLELLQAIAAGLPAVSEFLGSNVWTRLLAAIEAHNRKTNSFAEEVKFARTRLHQHELAEALPGWLARQKRLKDTTTARDSAETAKSNAESEIKKLEADILLHRPPADELNRELISYLGHDEIQLVTEQTGYRLTRRGAVAGNLSEGERTAIAFLYFLKSLSDRSFDLANGIVVVDDPISSLDTNSTYSAFGFMKRKLSDAGQLFVLTHNFTFFRLVRNWFDHVNRRKKKVQWPARFYMLRASQASGVRSAKIEVLDPFLQDYESEYHYLFKRVLEAAQWPGGQPLQTYYELPNLARRLLESFLAFRVPDEDNLHARLEAVTFDDVKKTRILRFVDTHSHAEQVGGGHDEASALAEAPEVLRNLIELIEGCDSEHAQRMRKAATT
jgi:wobble nucleotide-excising tRNase